MKRTCTFQFPNNEHSIPKLINSLTNLGDVKVNMIVEDKQYSRQDILNNIKLNLYFIESDTGDFSALKLAKRLKDIGTKFKIDYIRCPMKKTLC